MENLFTPTNLKSILELVGTVIAAGGLCIGVWEYRSQGKQMSRRKYFCHS